MRTFILILLLLLLSGCAELRTYYNLGHQARCGYHEYKHCDYDHGDSGYGHEDCDSHRR